MNNASHVFYTWLLAQVLNLFLFYLCFIFTNDPIHFIDVACICLLSALFSLPALLSCLCLFGSLTAIRGSIKTKFHAWLVILALAVLTNMLLLFLLFKNGGIAAYGLKLCLPAVLSVWLAAFIRYKIFTKHLLDNEMHYAEGEEKEDNLFHH